MVKEELEQGEYHLIPVEYLEPYCHGAKMVPIFTYRSNRMGLYKQFRCSECGHAESRCIAKPI